jgi:hypothetical protein
VEKSAFALAFRLASAFYPTPDSAKTHLSLLTFAVILSAAKDPEELNEPKPSVLFHPYPSAPLPLSVLFSPPEEPSFRPEPLTLL